MEDKFRCSSCNQLVEKGIYIPANLVIPDGDKEMDVKVCTDCAEAKKKLNH